MLDLRGPERAPCADVHKIAGAHLANVRVRAVRAGRTVALSDPASSMILDTAALEYAWPKGTPAFKPGTANVALSSHQAQEIGIAVSNGNRTLVPR